MEKITGIKAIPSRIERAQPYLGATLDAAESEYFIRRPYRALYSRYYETCFVRIECDGGQVGWGECLAPVAPDVAATIIEQLLSVVLIGSNPMENKVLRKRMYDLMRDRGYFGGFFIDSIAACDIALWDLKGKLLGQPVHNLIGGKQRTKVPCYVSGLGQDDDDSRVKYAESWAAEGFRSFKHAGGFGVNEDIETVRRLFAALGSDILVGLDAHWAYTPWDAERLGIGLQKLGNTFLEAPVDPEDVQAHARLSHQLTLPLAAGECLRTRYEFKPWIVDGALDILQPDVGRAGISETVELAAMAEPFSISIAPHLSVGLGPMIAASVHVAAAIPNLYCLEFQSPSVELANSMMSSGIEVDSGHYAIPDTDGLGIEMNEKRIRDAQV